MKMEYPSYTAHCLMRIYHCAVCAQKAHNIRHLTQHSTRAKKPNKKYTRPPKMQRLYDVFIFYLVPHTFRRLQQHAYAAIDINDKNIR